MKKKKDIVIILPDIRSAHNTGSFFRTGDAAGITKIYISGYTAPPPHPHVLKVSLGSEESVPWEHIEDTHAVIKKCREEGYQIVAVEQTPDSVDYRKADYGDKVALVFGNEVRGVEEEFLKECDIAIQLPMAGIKESLNVSVCGGIVIYALAYQQ